jgi:hypothetical protein
MQITRSFRIAIAASGEYTEFHGGTAGAESAINTTLGRVNQIYQQELGVTLQLVVSNSCLIFTDKFSDPFSENAATRTTTQECQNTLDLLIGSTNYDLGILFNTGQFGLAFGGSVGDSQFKGSACMGLPEPVGERFALLVAHEIGHQFGANHSFNTEMGLASGRRNPLTAVEPGSGSTLMGYAGLCGADSLQSVADGYFHPKNLAEIHSFLNSPSGNCASFSFKQNSFPVISAGSPFTIPVSTPFVLTAGASDPDGDSLLYSWEEMDIGPTQTLAESDNGFSPLFRSFPPTTNCARTFPQLDEILTNHHTPGEQLPSTNRDLHFRLVVRDNALTGAYAWADTLVKVTNVAGPFRVTSQSAPTLLQGEQLVSWDVAGTTNSPIDVSAVNILLSTNGGRTFDIPLASNIPNDGEEDLLFPSLQSTNARIKIEAVGNIFFAINDAVFSIAPPEPNDAPVLQTRPNPILELISEDAGAPAGAVGTLVSSLVDFAIPAGELDNVTDTNSGALLGIAITGADTGIGTWFYSLNGGTTWTSLNTVSGTNSLLLAANATSRLYLQPNANFQGFVSNAITFRAWDRTSGRNGGRMSTVSNGGATAFSLATDTASLNVMAINDAPILDPSKTPALNSVNEDVNAPSGSVGTRVSSLVDFTNSTGQLDNVTDVDSGALLGIAINSINTTSGTWFYSLNGGSTWATLDLVSDTNSLLLAANLNNRLYFQPHANFNGMISNAITFRAWDRTSGSDGAFASTTSSGGASAFSTATDTASINVLAVNDAPFLDASKNPTLSAITEGSGFPTGAVGTQVSSLVDFATPTGQIDNVTDVDSEALLGIAITGVNTANGTWFYSLNGGTTWNSVGKISNVKSLLLGAEANNRLYFQPEANFFGVISSAITFRAWDKSSGSDGTLSSTASNGGTTAFSSATDTASITVTMVQSYGQIALEPAGGYRISFIGRPGQQYRIQFCESFMPLSWQPLGTQIADAQGNYFIVDTQVTNTLRFYRSVTP